MTGWVADRDFRSLVALVQDARRDEPGPAVPWALLDGLLKVVRCDVVGLVELDLVGRRRLMNQAVFEDEDPEVEFEQDPDPDPDSATFWRYARDFIAPANLDGTGQILGVVRWSDMYSPTELRNQPLYAEYFHPECKHRIAVGLPTELGHTRRLLFTRGSGRDFSYRDKAVLELLRPHFHEIYLDARRRRDGIPRLTKREWQVLELAAQGHGNADIARLLFISLSTVRKHMENIFDRTGVRTRGAAIAKMMP